jgi:hypothetical protein
MLKVLWEYSRKLYPSGRCHKGKHLNHREAALLGRMQWKRLTCGSHL